MPCIRCVPFFHPGQESAQVRAERPDALCGDGAPCQFLPVGVSVSAPHSNTPKYANVAAALERLFQDAFDGEAVTEVWRTLGAVLAIGDIEVKGDETESFVDTSSLAIVRVVACLGFGKAKVPREMLCKIITHRRVSTASETFETPRDVRDASLARNALARWLYAQVFESLVSSCNVALGATRSEAFNHGVSPAKDDFIGVLDVFGFETSEVNNFDTLLINFANESLQQHFCEAVFKAELRLFEEEGISAPDMSEPSDSSSTIELITGLKAPPGILRILDAQCKAGGKSSKDSDAAFLAKVHSSHARELARTHPKERSNMFHVRPA